MNAAPKPDPVLHALNCQCEPCRAARRDEAAARREEWRGREALCRHDFRDGDICSKCDIIKPLKKAPRGSFRALVKLGRAS